MADSGTVGTPTKSTTVNTNPESPTTARPLDFDDDPQETGVAPAEMPPTSTQSANLRAGDAAPPKPPRPGSPYQQGENTLKEAFPTIELQVIKAVLVASGGDVERAFHALLGMTDPTVQEEAPPKPPRPTSNTQKQLEQDEIYARQLAEHYDRAGHRGPPSGYGNQEQQQPRRRETGLKPNELYDDREHSFFDDDLPVIRENIRKGFMETQTTVNKWFQDFKKKIDGEDEDDNQRPAARAGDTYGHGYGESQTYRTRRSGDSSRRSGDRERYDADPQVLGDDFSALELRDAESAPPRRPPRPLANPDLFKQTQAGQDRRRVSFQEGPPEEIDDLYTGGEPRKPSPSANGKSSKWQPLSAVDPSPVGEHDPFSLGDSDDEKDTKHKDPKLDEKSSGLEGASGDAGPAEPQKKESS